MCELVIVVNYPGGGNGCFDQIRTHTMHCRGMIWFRSLGQLIDFSGVGEEKERRKTMWRKEANTLTSINREKNKQRKCQDAASFSLGATVRRVSHTVGQRLDRSRHLFINNVLRKCDE